jgi:hypothetical protein
MAGADDDRLTGRLDEDQEALVAAATPLGFELRQPRKRPLEDHALTAFEGADAVLSRLTGEVDGAKVDVFEYDWIRYGSKGSVHRGRQLLAVLRHPAFEGEARCTRQSSQTTGGAVLDVILMLAVLALLFWILIPIVLIQRLRGQDVVTRDWLVGDPEFDKRFGVHAKTREAAIRALPIGFQRLAVSADLRGPIEIRPGMLAFGLEGKNLDAAVFGEAARLAKRIVGVYAPTGGKGGSAYRVATDALDDIAPASTDARRAER